MLHVLNRSYVILPHYLCVLPSLDLSWLETKHYTGVVYYTDKNNR